MSNEIKKEILNIFNRFKKPDNELSSEIIISIKNDNTIFYTNFQISQTNITLNSISDSEINNLEEIKKNNPMILSHLAIYEKIDKAKIVVQPDLMWCNVWSMLGEKLPRISYTHAKNDIYDIPCTNDILEYNTDYGTAIAKTVLDTILKNNYNEIGFFIKHSGAIIWGTDVLEIYKKASILEKLSKEAYFVKIATNSQYKYVPYQLTEELYRNSNEV